MYDCGDAGIFILLNLAAFLTGPVEEEEEAVTLLDLFPEAVEEALALLADELVV